MNNMVYNIKEILSNDKYIIPIYQRNYTWGISEISQLIKDINEFFKDSEDSNYYLGSLVCFKREDGSFELIDGQQRYTTLVLINLVLKNWYKDNKIADIVTNVNLKFDASKNVQTYIGRLYSENSEDLQDFISIVNNLNINEVEVFKSAIILIKEELKQIENIENFASNFYKEVYLFSVEVPNDTDLNHYFEIMNNRGEQLEKHEILKAFLMGKIKDNGKQKNFATIWNDCSDMNSYISLNIIDFFDNNGKLKAENLSSEIDEQSILDIIEANSPSQEIENKEEKEKYKSIIDFPNFLLQVLSIMESDISLDDKKLLKEFEKKLNIDDKFAEIFIYNLLKYRLLFDKFIIKQDLSSSEEEKRNWGIRIKDGKEEKKTYGNNEDDEELVKLQTMFYYANPTNTYNNWLNEILKFLNENTSYKDFTKKVFKVAEERFDKNNLSYDNISIFSFYYIDFLLWKLYKLKDNELSESNKIKSLKSKIDSYKEQVHSFKFKQLNSIEHLAPQAKSSLYKIDKDILNSIGNLCLISVSQNSQGNKEHPLDKKERYSKDNSSLKRLIMFSSFENDKWGEEQIKKHKEEIDELIGYQW